MWPHMTHTKIKIGQEWQLKNSTKTYIITKVSKYYCYGYDTVIINNISCTIASLENGIMTWPQDWEYLGNPVICEDCNKFCKQGCKYAK